MNGLSSRTCVYITALLPGRAVYSVAQEREAESKLW